MKPKLEIYQNNGFPPRVQGHPPPSVRWLKDSLDITDLPDYEVRRGEDGLCSLSIDETFAEDSARLLY